MNVRDLMIWASAQPDDLEVLFHVDGQGYKIGHAMAVPEWKLAYFGVDKDELASSLSEEMATEAEDLKDNNQPEDAEVVLKERDAFLEALERHENATDWKADPLPEGDPCCDTSCALPPAKITPVDPGIGVM